jgi:farnesyl diphosphate synthase
VVGFEQRLKACAADVESMLGQLLAPPAIGDVPERLAAAMRHAVLGGGKRFRPFLLVECANLFGMPSDQSMRAAAALECLHCYSLVHDDLPAMDNDALRRGQPTVWKAFDEWTAILAGDALLTLAFEILAEPATHADPLVRAQLSLGLARASGPAGMVGGQTIDLEADKLGQPAQPSLAHIQRLQTKKTGALIAYACEAGALLGQASETQRAALLRFGKAIGLAFQIADDLLDVEGDAATVGKAVAKDAAARKATTVSLLGIEAARTKLAEAQADAISALEPFGAKADVLRWAARFVSQRKS